MKKTATQTLENKKTWQHRGKTDRALEKTEARCRKARVGVCPCLYRRRAATGERQSPLEQSGFGHSFISSDSTRSGKR